MKHMRLASTASCLPEQVVSNEVLAEKVDTSDAWIQKRTGIRQRCIASDDESSFTLGLAAAQACVAKSGLTADSIDCVLVATCTPPQAYPSLACKIAAELGVGSCFALDINAACSGALYALDLLYAEMFRPKGWERVLIIGVDTMTRLVDWRDRNSCVLFGDGAGAMLWVQDSKPGLQAVKCSADGSGGALLYAQEIVSSATRERVFDWDKSNATTVMQGKEVFKTAVEKMTEVSLEVLKQADMDLEAVDWCVPHQANARILQAVCKQLGMPEKRLINTIGLHANTSAASVPLALDWGIKKGIMKPGDTVLCNAFGAGFTWGAAVIVL